MPAKVDPKEGLDALRSKNDALSAEKELLERRTAERAAAADEPIPVVLSRDNSLYSESNPFDPAPHLAAHGLTKRDDMDYRWGNRTNSQVLDGDIHRGYSLVAGGKVTSGTMVLMERPLSVSKAEMVEHVRRTKLREVGTDAQFDQSVRAAGGIPLGERD